MSIRRVILESPFRGSTPVKEDEHRRYAQACLRDSLMRGEAPMASHLLYTQALDDRDPHERSRGIEAGLAWGAAAEVTVVYVDHGISEGMQVGIERAKAEGRSVEYRSLAAEDGVMTKTERESVQQRLAEAMDYAGCGDTSCHLRRVRGGQATNGGCRCMSTPDGRVVYRQLARLARNELPRALDAIEALEAENERLQEAVADSRAVLEACATELLHRGADDGSCSDPTCIDHARGNALRLVKQLEFGR